MNVTHGNSLSDLSHTLMFKVGICFGLSLNMLIDLLSQSLSGFVAITLICQHLLYFAAWKRLATQCLHNHSAATSFLVSANHSGQQGPQLGTLTVPVKGDTYVKTYTARTLICCCQCHIWLSCWLHFQQRSM